MLEQSSGKYLWWERGLALVATLNLGLVFFDLSYIPWRGFYAKTLPGLTQTYDRVKGIEPHRDTSKYLATVARLRQQQNFQSPAAKALLQDLANQSQQLVESNPFQLVGKTGTLEKIKNRIRQHMGQESAKEGFRRFWSGDNWQAHRAQGEWDFFDRQLRPLWASNYFRETGEDGDFIDYFWAIDLGFMVLFGVDLLWKLSRRRKQTGQPWRWLILERWYDLPLLLPGARWLRAWPVLVRWHQAQLIDLSQWQHRVNGLVVGELTEELTQAVVTQVLGQAQQAITSGVAGQMVKTYLLRPTVDLNDINEVEAIAQLVLEIAIYRVIPKIQPDLEQLVVRLLEQAMVESTALQNLRLLPGFAESPQQILDGLVRQVSDALYLGLTKALNDPQNGRLARRLAEHLGAAVGDELQKGHTIDKLEALVVDLLKEMAASYRSGNN